MIALLDVVGNADKEEPAHIGATALNVGVIIGFTTIVSVVGIAHPPLAGVNVYVVLPAVEVLMVAGNHVPVIPLLDVAGKGASTESLHTGPTAVNKGVTDVFTTTSIEYGVAHCPAVGVKVYVNVPSDAVLIDDGDQVPFTPLLDVAGKAEGVALWQ